MSEARRDPRLGASVAGCRVTRFLAAGAMGAVYLAERLEDGATVVVKFMAPEVAGDATARARFAREAHALSRLPAHPNVVHVLGVALDASPPCLVLEHAPGSTLDVLLHERGRLPPLEAARIGLDVARGLAVIHAQGIVHRDLKPSNVVLGPGGVARIIDFGISRDDSLSGITAPGQLVGTTHYMPPERLNASDDRAEDDPRGDLWSLGAVLYHLMTGAPPFDTPDLAELMEAVAEAAWTPLEVALGAHLPPGLEDVVGQLLEPALPHRYARARDVAQDLERVLAGQEVELPGLVAPDGRRAVFERGVERLVVGRGPTCALALDDPSVSERHAQVRRTPGGFELLDLGSAEGTLLDDVPVTAPATPRDGQRVRVGAVTLEFRDPRGRGEVAPVGAGDGLEAAALAALVAAGDLRLVAWHVEQAWPSSASPDEATRVEAARALAWLARTGLAPEVTTAAGWAAWWVGRHADLPVQLGPAGAAPRLELEATGLPGAGDGRPLLTRALSLDDGVLRVGRDARCEVRLERPQVSRVHVTLVRLHRRWALRNESQHGTLLGGVPVSAAVLAPGDRLVLGDVALTLR